MSISLRGRIAIWYSVALPAVVLLMSFIAQQVLVLNMRGNLDESLRLRAEAAVAAIRTSIAAQTEDDYTDLAEVIRQLAGQELFSIPLFMRIGLPQGDVIEEVGEIPRPIVPFLDRQLRIAELGEGRFETVSLGGVETLRVYSVAVQDQSGARKIGVVQAGESLSQVVTAQNQLWRYTLIVGIPGSFVALLVGLFILYRGFRPLDRILQHVHSIESSNLQTGLPDEPRPPELQQLADSLNSMLERLDSAFRAKQMFVASVSHEIRTPLTALEGQIDVLLMQPFLDAETRDSLERMSREARRLVQMTNSLLLNAQLDTQPILMAKEVKLRELLQEVIAEIWVLARDIDLGLSADEEVAASGDYDLIKQMTINLLDNAIKFTPRGGRVDIALTREDGWAVIEVSDTGRGIPSYHLPFVMRPFYKVDGRGTGGRQGAGLGLAIVKQIVEIHRGEIEIKSQLGAGTTVRVRLPARRPSKAAAQTTRQSLVN